MAEDNEGAPGKDLRFRLATLVDMPALISLINAAYAVETFLEGTRTDDARLKEQLHTGSILVAEYTAGCVLGCVYVEVRGERGYLGQFAVDPAHQGLGLARSIIAAAEGHLQQLGCKAVDITVLSLRPELLPIYRRFGYVEAGTEEFHADQLLKDGRECHCIVMSKEL